MELKGKVINFLGDSITQGVGVENIEENRFDNVIKKKCGLLAANNYGISGTRIAYQSKASESCSFDLYFCGRVLTMAKKADVVIVFGGTNDYGHGDAPFGSMADATPDTFCGACEHLMNSLSALYPDSKVVFLTPAHREADAAPSARPMKLPDAKPLADYCEVIKEKCRQHGFYFIEMFSELGIDPNNEDDKIKYAPDGLHFNDAGHARIAEVVINFLKKI